MVVLSGREMEHVPQVTVLLHLVLGEDGLVSVILAQVKEHVKSVPHVSLELRQGAAVLLVEGMASVVSEVMGVAVDGVNTPVTVIQLLM